MATHAAQSPTGIEIHGAGKPAYDAILTPAALEFLAALSGNSPRGSRSCSRHAKRARSASMRASCRTSSPRHASIRESEWKVAPIPQDLLDRRVEITGPTDRKMIINALNSGAKVFMADCEDSLSPTWDNVVSGQINLLRRRAPHDRARERRGQGLSPEPADRRAHRAAARLAPAREAHDARRQAGAGRPWSISGSTCSTTRKSSPERGTGPYFYLPKLESHREARLWAEVFDFSEKRLGAAARRHQGAPCSSRPSSPRSRWTRSSGS